MPRELESVVLEHDLPEHDLCRGDLGAVVHMYDEATVDVEFVRASGEMQALVRLPINAIRALSDQDIPTVRSIEPGRGDS